VKRMRNSLPPFLFVLIITFGDLVTIFNWSLKDNSPLFTKWGSNNERLTKVAIDKKFRENATGLGFISNEDLENGYNPARPHSLRSAFRSHLTGKVADTLIEFWMGHALGEQVRAYLNLPAEELRELYMNAEKYLSIEKTSREELEERKGKVTKFSDEYEKRITQFEGYIEALRTENMAFRTDNSGLKERVSKVEEGWKKQEFLYNELAKLIGEKGAEMEIIRVWIEQDKKNKELEEERKKNFEAARE